MNKTAQPPAKIEVIETQTEAKPVEGVAEAPGGPVPGPEGLEEAEKAAVAREIEVRLQPVLLDAAISTVGNLLQNFTKMEQMNFNKAEHDALMAAWLPLLPLVSPWTNATLTTLIILDGKGLYYRGNRPKSAEKPESTAAKEKQSGPESGALKPTE